MSKSKQKGTLAETAVTSYLNELELHAMRYPPQGSKDKGDIYIADVPVVVEVKNCVRTELSAWLTEVEAEKINADYEIGAVWFKKKGTTDPGKWYVTLSGSDFRKLLHTWKVLRYKAGSP